jgi:hypothetical protein
MRWNQIADSSSSSGHKFQSGRCECRGEFLTDLLSHRGREMVGGCCTGSGEWVVPRRWEELVHYCEIGLNGARLRKKIYLTSCLCRGVCSQHGMDRCACVIGLNNAKAKKLNSYNCCWRHWSCCPRAGKTCMPAK